MGGFREPFRTSGPFFLNDGSGIRNNQYYCRTATNRIFTEIRPARRTVRYCFSASTGCSGCEADGPVDPILNPLASPNEPNVNYLRGA